MLEYNLTSWVSYFHHFSTCSRWAPFLTMHTLMRVQKFEITSLPILAGIDQISSSTFFLRSGIVLGLFLYPLSLRTPKVGRMWGPKRVQTSADDARVLNRFIIHSGLALEAWQEALSCWNQSPVLPVADKVFQNSSSTSRYRSVLMVWASSSSSSNQKGPMIALCYIATQAVHLT